MTRAAIYLRISQDATGEALGVTRQQEDCLQLADSLGWEVAEVYSDNDISATSGKVRPRYNAMLAAIEAGQVEAVIAWSPDRLYRRLADLETLIPVIEGRDVQVRTVKAGDLDLSSAYGRMIARILGAIATGEGEVKAERWKRSWRQGREMGLHAKTGTRLFGYTRDGEVIPEEAAIAQQMAKDIASGVSILKVTQDLERAGIKTTRGNVWRTGTVRQYLSQPRIAGYSTLKGEIVAEGTWEPIVDRDTWETVRALFTGRARERAPRVALLGGLIYCGKCGARLITGKARRGRIYRCRSGRPGMEGCGGVSAYAEPVEEKVEAYARARLDDPRVWQRIAELRAGSDTPALLSEINALEARLIELEQQLEEPGVPVASITRAMGRARDRLAECQKRLADDARSNVPAPYVGGEEWPDALADRRELIAFALSIDEERVWLDPWDNSGPRAFDPNRVRIS